VLRKKGMERKGLKNQELNRGKNGKKGLTFRRIEKYLSKCLLKDL